MTAVFPVLILASAAFAAGPQPFDTATPEARAWIEKFNQVCAGTTGSMALSKDELKSLISRADNLKGRLGALEDSAKKVYSRRLGMCHDMYEFALEVKGNAGK